MNQRAKQENDLSAIDDLAEIFKRCVRDRRFRNRFITDPRKTIIKEGYLINSEDLEEIDKLAHELRLSDLQ